MNNHTFLNLVKKDLLNSAFILFCYIFSKHLFRLSRVLQTLVVVVDIKKHLILEVNQLILIVHGLYFLSPFSLDLPDFFFLHSVHRISDALPKHITTFTN